VHILHHVFGHVDGAPRRRRRVVVVAVEVVVVDQTDQSALLGALLHVGGVVEHGPDHGDVVARRDQSLAPHVVVVDHADDCRGAVRLVPRVLGAVRIGEAEALGLLRVRFDVLLLHLLKPRFEAVGFGPLARPVLLDFLPLEVLVLFGHDQVFAHADGEALVQAALLAEASRDRRDLALVVEGALELLLDEGVPSEEGLAALARDGVEVVAEGFVAAHPAHFQVHFYLHRGDHTLIGAMARETPSGVVRENHSKRRDKAQSL
jgi:hypothetical protein